MLKVRKGTQQNVNTWTGGGARIVCEYRYTTRCRHLNLTSSRDIGKVLLAWVITEMVSFFQIQVSLSSR